MTHILASASSPDPITAVARALDIDPDTVRSDTPVAALGWTGTAGEWMVLADHLGHRMRTDPPAGVEPATIADLVAIVEASSHPE